MTDPVDGAAVGRRIKNVRIRPVHLREGYDMGEVDMFLDELEQAAVRGEDLAGRVRSATFAKVRWREGYDIEDVDHFLAEMATIHPVPATPADVGADPRADIRPPSATSSGSAWAIRSLIERIRFTPVRLREGYDMAEVDALLDEVVDAAERGETIAGVIERAHLKPARLREGYDMAEVDSFLAQLAHPDTSAIRPDLVEEHPGLIERLRRKL